MPGDEVEDGIGDLFQLDITSQGQHLPHAVNGSWPVLSDNQWVGKQRQSVEFLNFSPKSYGVQQLGTTDSLTGSCGDSIRGPYKPNYTKLTPVFENNRSHIGNYQLNTNESLFGNQGFQTIYNQPVFYNQHNLTLRGLPILKSQQEYDSGIDSPTLTANSERSEITEVSTDFNFLRGQRQLVRDHHPGIVQPVSMQQSSYNDMQLLQQHMMLKQLQELQRQQQFQQLGDVRQQNPLTQLSAMSKQAAGGQFSPLNGTPINDASQMFMNWVQSGASTAAQGVPNRLMFSPEQGQSLRSMGLVPQPPDVSLYGTPVASAKGNIGQYPHIQGVPQAQKPALQTSGLNNPFLRDQFTVNPDQVSMTQGAFISSQGFSGKSIFGQAPNQGLNNGIFSGGLQEANSLQTNGSVNELNGRQEQTGWSGVQQKSAQQGPSQGLVPLDPMEEKILYNMDENIWDASFGRRTDMGAFGFGNTLESTDLSNSFPSIQSGSWSALMQSAVAEVSSSDTGLQEEWSGLTFQNMEQSTDNQLSNFIESDNQQTGWVDNNLPSASSFTSKPLHIFNDSSMNSSFPGFQQPGIQFSVEQRQGLRQDGSQESMEKSTKVTGEWIDCNPQQKPSTEGSQQVQSFRHSNNAWAGQIYERSESDMQQQRMASHRENSHLNFSAVPNTVKAHQAMPQQASQSIQADYMRHADISLDRRGKESTVKGLQQISNGHHVSSNSYEGEGETYDKQKSCYQRENCDGSYNSKGLSGYEQGYSGQFLFLSNSSSNAMSLEQGFLDQSQGKPRASEEVPSKGGLRSVGSDGSNVASQARCSNDGQNMLELLHKVDQSRDDSTTTKYGSADYSSLAELPEAETHTSGPQLHNQSSTSKGFGLRLAPPQRLPNSSHIFSAYGSPQTVDYRNSRQVNSDLREKNQTWVASPSSFHASAPSRELSQRAHWDDKASASEQSGTPSYLNVQGNSIAPYTPTQYVRNQHQMQLMSSAAVAPQASQATLANNTSRYPLFNLATSQDSSQQTGTNPLGQQFPVLEATQVSQPPVISGMSQQGEVSARPHNVWTSVPIQGQHSAPERLKHPSNLPSSMNPSNNSIINAPKGVYGSAEFVVGSQQQISSETLDVSHTAAMNRPKPLSKHISVLNALSSGSLVAQTNQQVLDGLKNDDKHDLADSEGKLVSVSQSVESSTQIHQNYSLQQQVQAMKNVENDRIKRMGQYGHNSTFGNRMEGGQNLGAQPDSFPCRETKTMSFLTEATEDPSAKAFSQLALQDQPSDEMVKFDQSQSRSNVVSDLTEQSQPINLHMAPSWFRQYGTLKNGQMLPMYDARLASLATRQFSLVKPSQNLHLQASVEQIDAADASRVSTIVPSTGATLVGTEQSSGPFVLSSEIVNQSMGITRPKKRKSTTSELLPWHKEVTEGSRRLLNMSMAEQDWAQATNRAIEKIEDEVEMIEDVQPVLRSKRRLVLTTQLMQQLLRPTPESVLSADAASNYDGVMYFLSRLALGDACSLTHSTRTVTHGPMDNSNMISDKLKTSEGTCEQQFSFVEKFTARWKKLENDFHRVDNLASIADIRVECQELERFSVINRFAKFHIRGQADTSGTLLSSSMPKPIPQRYVTPLQMPRKLPEGLQCVSL